VPAPPGAGKRSYHYTSREGLHRRNNKCGTETASTPLVQALAIVGVANTFRGLRSLVGAIHATVYL